MRILYIKKNSLKTCYSIPGVANSHNLMCILYFAFMSPNLHLIYQVVYLNHYINYDDCPRKLPPPVYKQELISILETDFLHLLYIIFFHLPLLYFYY